MYCCILWFLFVFNLFDKFQMGSKMVDENIPDVVLQRCFRLCPPKYATEHNQRIRASTINPNLSWTALGLRKESLYVSQSSSVVTAEGSDKGLSSHELSMDLEVSCSVSLPSGLCPLVFPISKGGTDAAKPEEEYITDYQ